MHAFDIFELFILMSLIMGGIALAHVIILWRRVKKLIDTLADDNMIMVGIDLHMCRDHDDIHPGMTKMTFDNLHRQIDQLYQTQDAHLTATGHYRAMHPNGPPYQYTVKKLKKK